MDFQCTQNSPPSGRPSFLQTLIWIQKGVRETTALNVLAGRTQFTASGSSLRRCVMWCHVGGNGALSDWEVILTDTRLGCVLGPVLFSMLINGLYGLTKNSVTTFVYFEGQGQTFSEFEKLENVIQRSRIWNKKRQLICAERANKYPNIKRRQLAEAEAYHSKM